MIVANKEKTAQAKENDFTENGLKRKHIMVRVIILTIIIVLLSSLYLIYAWNRYQDEASSQAIALAESVEAIMPQKYISQLSGNVEDLDKP